MKKALLLVLLLPLLSSAQSNPVRDSLEHAISELAKPVYIEAYKIVNTAKYKINNAVTGRYPTKEAISYYNDNLSQYMGSYKTIQATKKRLDTAGDAFVEAVYLREKARIAKTLADQQNERILEFQAEQSFEGQKAKKPGMKDLNLTTLPAIIDSSWDFAVPNPIDYGSEIFTIVEIEARYPGNWTSFLERNLSEEVPVDNGASPGTYTVIIQFIVDVAGNVSDVKALTKKGHGMEEEAMRVIKRSGKWQPAVQNGREVKAYRKQPITFTIHGVASKK